ncbi:Two-component sensor protein yhcY [mine drainage metagenome]|uniref:Two-component sensor protein yhcY n=1 Tax=mine drainage metagenome TaxID=410659 RepID=T1AHM9_9ZZZZ
MLGERTGWITLGEEHGEPQLIVGVNLPPALEAQGRSALRWGPCRCQRAGTRDESGFSPCERLEMVSGENGGLLYHASTPLRVGRRTIGILNIASSVERSLGYEEHAALTAGAQSIALAVERLRTPGATRPLNFLSHSIIEQSSPAVLPSRISMLLMIWPILSDHSMSVSDHTTELCSLPIA